MMSSNTKKRRVGPSSLPSDDGEINNGLVHEELKTMSSHMTNMMQMMQGMKGEISRLKEKCDRMEKSIDTMQRSQNENYSTTNQMNQTINAMKTAQNTISANTNSRFDAVDNKQKHHEVLLRNQQWKYSAPRPSQEYWDDLDEDEDDAAEEFLTQIKKCTEEMRYGTGNGDIYIDADLPYNEEFLPHWKEFANALEQYQYRLKCLPKDTDSTLHLCEMELPNELVELLSKALESTQFTSIALQNNRLEQAGIDFSLKYSKSNKRLKGLTLVDNPINMEQIKQLCQVVEVHLSIEELNLDGCRGGAVDGYEMLQTIMSAGKHQLNLVELSNNNISTGGDTFISDFLKRNPMLKTLFLDGNELDDNDTIAIAGALKHNTNLCNLSMLKNRKMTGAGWAALRKAEYDGTSLNSAAESNHTCYITYPSGEDEIQGLDTSEMNGNSEYNFAPNHVRQMKVYSVLSSRNRQCSNVGHFDDIPVEFLPNMLSTIQQYSEYHRENSEMSQGTSDVNPLSLVYEVCRYWDKSLAVYELLSS